MSEIKKIAIIGGTGKLGVPVVKILSEKGFQIRAIVRDFDKAKRLLPANVELVLGDLNDSKSIEESLKNMDAVYINLSTETTNINLPFYEEREGVKNIVKAAQKNNLKHIYKIGALGTYPLANHIKMEMTIPNKVRVQGQKFIENSGINFTIFDPTMFMENLPAQIKNGKIQWIGKGCSKYYWIAAQDYARQVFHSINNPLAVNKHYPIEGTEYLTAREALKIFIESYDSNLKIQFFPIWVVKFLGLFDKKMQYLGHMMSYLDSTPDFFYAQETWKELGEPKISVLEFAQKLKKEI